MEFKITEKKNATICLNMIVKNESHIIETTLEKLCQKISFDYWVICDTGSTDNTCQIITDFFKNKEIQGELFHDEWQNFAHNRTLALERAYKKTDLLLVFDADDEIVGDLVLPTHVLFDEYYLKFGSDSGFSYSRVLLINNHKRFQFLSVIHEFINCKEGPTTSTTINGDYYVISGRTGSRSLDPDKYLKDALILGKAYHVALADNDPLFHRYAFYCANSYKDCGQYENAITWYKITLSHEKQWPQEKYISCLYIFDCLNALNRKEEGFFYLVKSFQYDNERVECLFPLLVHYCCENMPRIAYNYYLLVKEFYENHYLNTNITNKLFVAIDKFDFFVPYYMILIADKVQDFSCVIKMYEMVFQKKPKIFEDWYVKNFLYNLQFFLQHVSDSNLSNFVIKVNDYIQFLNVNGVHFENYDFLNKDVYKNAGINFEKYIINPVFSKPQNFSKQQCSQSKNILIYTGFSDINWNYTYTLKNALGGSEKAVAYLSKCFPKDYTIYISGHVENETIDNIHYIHLDELTNLINFISFHTVIVSRYISFYDMFPTCSFYQSYIWAHDTLLLPYGSNLNDNQILKKWDNYINGCICLTDWHKNQFSEKYPILKNKITIINNGIDLDSFPSITNNYKIKNRFIYTSRPERGLNNLLNLWPKILEKIPDATLTISNYGNFPSNPEENDLKNIIYQNSDTIHYLGKLNTEKLYEEMNKAEFWLYPTHWPETSCITALEMLMSEVICLYYPVAGLTNTMDKYGIQVCSGKEIETIVSLSKLQKNELRENGKNYAISCSWENRFISWNNLIFGNNDNIKYNDEQIKKRIYELYYSKSSIPSDHVNFLKKLKDEYHFEPKVIYDIGANVLHWTKEAKNIWNNSEIIVFDAITTAKFLYEEQKLKHYIGVLSDEDNKIVRFYENIEHPAGNSYYQEIGHPNSKFLYSDNSFTEQKSTTLTKAVNSNNFPYPDLIKMDVQGAELDIIKGSLETINKAQYLIVELQHTQYNKGAPLCNVTISFLNKNGWKLIAEKFSDNGADADYCFKNLRYNNQHKNIAIFNSFPFHYEMFGYIINNCKKNNHNLTIFTNTNNSLGWLEFYDSHFKEETFDFKYKNINEFEYFKNNFDLIFITTDDDYEFKNEWINDKFINDKCISINHYYTIRRDEYKYNLGTRPFMDNSNEQWAIPCYKILNSNDKQNMFESEINIVIIGGLNDGLNYNIINRVESNNQIVLHVCGRNPNSINIRNINNSNIIIKTYFNIDTIEMIGLLKKCDFILTDCSNNTNHINGKTMSGVIPLAFSTLTPLIISTINNNIYNFKNVIEFDFESNDKIIIIKNKVNINLLEQERNDIIYMFDNYIKKFYKIPKKIIQTWKNKDLNPEFQKMVDLWKINNSDYTYTFFDDRDCEQFIKNHFDKDILNIYNCIIPGAYKADLFRYCYLYIYGGVYIDIDTLCIGKLDDFLSTNVEFIVPIDLNINPNEGLHNIFNSFIASIPKHPILLECINKIVYNIKNKIIPPSPLDFTGPGILGSCINKFLNNNETDSFIGKEGINNNIYFLKFEEITEYVKDINGSVLFQNKNGNNLIRKLYNVECSKLTNYVSWVNCDKNKVIDYTKLLQFIPMIYSSFFEKRQNTFIKSFQIILEKLLNRNNTYNIVELGSSRSFVNGNMDGCLSSDINYWHPYEPCKWDWGAGIFTKVFCENLMNKNYNLYTIDPDKNANTIVKIMCQNNENVKVVADISTNFLTNFSGKIDFLYMDHMETSEEAAILHLNDIKLVIDRNLMSYDGVILIDDVGENIYNGKGKYTIPYLLQNNYEILIHEYQVLLKRNTL